jgi:predicted ATPase with chaperone activity
MQSRDVFYSTIEVEARAGIGIHLVGLADIAVKETLLRTITALQACGYRIPGKKIIINICPTFLHRNTNGFDLPIALAIIKETEQADIDIEGLVFHSELGLDGSLRTTGVEQTILAKLQGDKSDYELVGGESDLADTNVHYKGFGNLAELVAYLGN